MSQHLTRRVCYSLVDSEAIPPWLTWQTTGPTGVEGVNTPSVLFTDDPSAPVPNGYTEVRRGQHLPVSSREERAIVRSAQSLDGLDVADRVRRVRRDPTFDWLLWSAPLTETSATAYDHWLSVVGPAPTTAHSHILLRPVNTGWAAWCGLASIKRPVSRDLGGTPHYEFPNRGTALAVALERIRTLRAELMEHLQSSLAGWTFEALRLRLCPSREMRLARGWEPLLPNVSVWELMPKYLRDLRQHGDRTKLMTVEEIAVDDLPESGTSDIRQTAAA